MTPGLMFLRKDKENKHINVLKQVIQQIQKSACVVGSIRAHFVNLLNLQRQLQHSTLLC